MLKPKPRMAPPLPLPPPAPRPSSRPPSPPPPNNSDNLRCRLRRASSRSAAPLSGRLPQGLRFLPGSFQAMGSIAPDASAIRGWRVRRGRGTRVSAVTPHPRQPRALRIVGTALRRHKARMPGQFEAVVAADSFEVLAAQSNLDLERAVVELRSAAARHRPRTGAPARDLPAGVSGARSATGRRRGVRARPGATGRRRGRCAPTATRGRRDPARRRSTCGASPVRSILLYTTICGTVARADRFEHLVAPARCGRCAPDRRRRSRAAAGSASRASCSVERNAATSSCGRSRTKPTVSASTTSRPGGEPQAAHGRIQRREQLVGRRRRRPPVSALNSVDLPAFV